MQQIPDKESTEPSKWSKRSLFPVAAAVQTITKLFTTPVEILLGFSVLIIGITTLLGHWVPWGFYVLTLGLLLASICERIFLTKHEVHMKKVKDKL